MQKMIIILEVCCILVKIKGFEALFYLRYINPHLIRDN